MRIALVNTATPFIRGGAEILVDDLAKQLEARGHSVALFRIPFPADFTKPLIHTIESVKLMRFDEYDKLIAFKFPAYCIEHRNKTVWMFHQFRQAYELWDTPYGLKDTPENRALRDVVRHADASLLDAQHVFTNAYEVSNRLKKYNGYDAEVLPPPLENVERYYCAGTNDTIFYPSRVNSFKRQLLAVEAMQYVKTDVKLLIAGVCEDAGYEAKIRQCIKRHGLSDTVRFENRWISNEEKYEWMAGCLGALYLAYKEDSCGFVSMEAFYSEKPVITCTDSGGTVELIDEGQTGCFCAPDPRSLAQAMDKLYADKEKTIAMGKAARAEIVRRDITWDNTIRRLLG